MKRWMPFLLVTALLGVLCAASFGQTRKRPNILLAISDDQSYPYTSAYGHKGVRTPAFDQVAKKGMLFNNAFVASPGCSPSRAALLTGRHTWQLEHAGTHASSFSPKYAVYPDLLERDGYFVGYTGKGWGPGDWKVGGRARNPAGPEYSQHKQKSVRPGTNPIDYAANFQAFLAGRPKDQPFCFWYGGHEPHRAFAQGTGLKAGKKLEDVEVPPFLPDTPEIRSDLLDYLVEIEWFDQHLGRMLKMLEEAGELDNTLVVVTSDNGMSFPRAKANLYEYGIHVPLTISWPGNVPAGRVVDTPVSLVDLAPTILEAAGVKHPGAPPMVGRSLMGLLKSGTDDASRQMIFSGRERHSSSRHDNLGYPSRVVRTREYLYIRNLKPERWPAGDPRKYEESGELGPMHGAYHDIDEAPTLSFLVANHNDPKIGRFLHLAVDKRPAEELYDIRQDRGCLNNLAQSAQHADVKKQMAAALERYLTDTHDPHMAKRGEVFETYPRYSPIRKFPPSP